ncbi:DUF3098 domain-containing protein [Moheibacter sediminis]|uniref:DUF3098 domain-containing protein n=1 Tax=Moheibacter sediminis TaxID=1434700 RepID=A0A1W2B1W5_9FLAO|nr:DUF3098 domain-containing protein [Moheibacter sediminis]SMC66408.1 Protein of unknown function [Moheibacter sediminis]
MSKIKIDNSRFSLLFGKKNYMFMGIGLAFILVGFLLMMGQDANTRPDGTFDTNYWNDGIFSWRRIRLAPFLILVGFAIEVYAIMLNPEKSTK